MKSQRYKKISYLPYGSGRGRAGFTMVEVIVAMAILSTSMMAVFGVLRICLVADTKAVMLTKSTLAAESLFTETVLKKPISYQTTENSDGVFDCKIQIAATDIDELAAVRVESNWRTQQIAQQSEMFFLVHIQAQFEGK